MRVCFVCNEYPPGPHGGIGTFTQVLARGLVAAGHQVRVAGVYHKNYPSPDYEEDHGVQVWRFREPSVRFGWVLARRRLYRQIASWCRQGASEIVEVPDWAGWAAGWPKLPVPVVARLNGSASYFAAEIGGKIKKRHFWLERASLRRADFWCSVSKYTGEKTRKLFGLTSGPDAILYNPVESQQVADRRDANPRDVVFTGTLTEKKGVIPLFRAWNEVAAQSDDAFLHIYGKDQPWGGGTMKEHLLSLLDDAAKGRVKFHGHLDRKDLFQALRRAGLAIFPSYAEAFALAPLEAMGCGCPTIASSRGAGKELLEHGEEGFLVDPDDPDQIASSILRLLSDQQLANRLGEAGRRRVTESFTIDKLRTQNEQFYSQCMEQFSARGEALARSPQP